MKISRFFFLSVIVTFFLYTYSFGQTLFPFDQNEASWTYWVDRGIMSTEDTYTYSLLFQGNDTLINGNVYAIVKSAIKYNEQEVSEGEVFLLREVNKMLFLYDSAGDILIYDFSNLNIGDKLLEKNFISAFPQDTISQKDSIQLLDGSKRQRYTVSSGGDCFSYLIEGIGSTREFVPNLYGCAEYMAGLICHSVNGQTLYEDSLFLDNEDCFVITSTNHVTYKETIEIFISPNPVWTSKVNIHITPLNNIFHTKLSVVLYSALGEKLSEYSIAGLNTSIDVSSLSRGIYWLVFYSEKTPIKSEKLILID